MTSCVYKAKVEMVGKTQEFSSGFKKRELVLVDDPSAERPDYAVFEFSKDRCAQLDGLRKGDEVEVSFFPSARYWEPQDKSKPGRWFCSCRAVGIKTVGQAVPTSAPATAKADTKDNVAADPDNDLPF